MNEGLNMDWGPEKIKIQQKIEDELLADYFTRHKDAVIAPENLREAEPEIAQFENLVASFESTHTLAELHLIIDLTPEEAPKHPVREPARIALAPIVSMLKILKKETNISSIKYEELREKYMSLSRAVGMINNNKVHHDR